MGTHEAKKRRSAQEVVPPLLIGVLGTGGVVTLLFLNLDPKFQFLDMVCLLVVVGFATLGYSQRILRGLLSAMFLYFATGMSAAFYEGAAPYIGAPFGGEPNRDNKTLAFIVLVVVIWIALEAISRALLKGLVLPQLRFLDNVGGVLIYLVVGVLVAVLIFNAIGYSEWGAGAHDAARLRPEFRQVFRTYYVTQSFWFGEMPMIYRYDFE